MTQAHYTLTTVRENGLAYLEGSPDEPLMRRVGDVNRVLEACFGEDIQAVLLYAPNLTPGFFDLKTGEAGEILQKLRTFHVRFALVCPPGSVELSQRFRELLLDERRGSDFYVFDTRDDAVRWLASGS